MSDSDWQDDDQGEWEDDGPAKSTPLETGIMHGLQGATGGFLDEISGAGEAAGRALGLKGIGGKFSDVGMAEQGPAIGWDNGPTIDWEVLRDAYREGRDRKRGILKQQSEENPWSAGAGEFAGMVASPLNKIGAGASLAKSGAALGGLNALGASEAEDLSGMTKDTFFGAGLGGAVGKAASAASPLLEKGIGKISSTAGDLADSFAARALGAERGTIKSMGIDKVKGAGRQALDEGVLSPLVNADDMIARNAAVKNRGGEMMGEAYKAIDDVGASTFNPLKAATDVEEKIGSFYRSPINKGETNQLENTLESILMRGDKDIPLAEAQLLKEELGKVANWKNNLNITDKEKMARDAYGVVSKHIDNAVSDGAYAIEAAGLSDALSQGKKLFSKASDAEKLLQNKQAREQGNNLIGLTDTITGGAALGYGGATDDWKGAAGVVAGKKILQKYGAQNAAIGLDKISKTLLKSPQMADLLAKKPQVFNALVEKLGSQFGKKEEEKPKTFDPSALVQKAQGTKYAGVLQNAVKRGGPALGATHFILQSTDPDYRKSMLENEENPFEENGS